MTDAATDANLVEPDIADDGWRDVLLETVATELTVGHVGPMASEYIPEGVPFLRSQNVEPMRINSQDLKFIGSSFHERLRKSALRPGDVVIVRTGKPGACAVIPDWMPVSNCSDLVIVRCEALGLTEDELAFYDALETNDSAVKVLGDETLRDIARELVQTVRANVTIDWSMRENVRAQLRVLVKRILRKHGYPPDKQEAATNTVLQQAELSSEHWLAAAA